MLAAAIRIQRHAERNIRRLVMREDAFRAFFEYLRAQRGTPAFLFRRRDPAIVDGLALIDFVAALQIRDRAPPLARSGRRDWKFGNVSVVVCHGTRQSNAEYCTNIQCLRRLSSVTFGAGSTAPETRRKRHSPTAMFSVSL